MKYGQEQYIIRDQYFQTARLDVTVEDTILELSHEVLELKGSNPEYVYARESYKGIKSFTKSNDNIRVTKKLLPDGWEVLEVFPEKDGETILKVYDYQDNVDSVRVVVGGSPSTSGETGSGSTGTGATGTGSETSSSEKIRYIRDWANGSDKNGTNYWVEIQALERITGSNVALGKTVTGLRPGTPSYPYTRIVDGDINSSNYAQVSGRNALTNIQVDLGALYDVEKIKIWHYYTDGRIFRETKTEVSADGVNWITLFDSSVSGTYPEPKKGEGRTYEVKKPLSPEEQELQDDINTILQSLGLENLEINSTGIEINSAANAFRCELGNTGKYFVKPQYASCVEGNNSMAWKCNPGYTDLDYKGINTCVKNENLKYVDQLSVTIREDEREIKLNWDGINSKREVILSTYNTRLNTKTSKYITNFRDKIITLREIVVSNSQYPQITKDMVVFILDDLLNELDNKVDKQVKDEKDIKATWNQLQLYANNGYIGEFQSTSFRSATRGKIESEASIFATKLEDYLYTYSNDYKTGLSSYASQLSTSGGNSLAEMTTGAREGVREATRDYIMSYYDAAQTLSELDLNKLKTGIKGLWNKVVNPRETLGDMYTNFKTQIDAIYEKLLVLTGYEGAKGGSYTATSIGLGYADPAGKVVNLASGGFFVKISEKIDNLIWYKPLGLGHTGRYIPNNLNEKLALEQAMKNPLGGIELPVTMTDSRWMGTEGWVKMSQNINGIEIHYVFNKKTKQIDDFKFKD